MFSIIVAFACKSGRYKTRKGFAAAQSAVSERKTAFFADDPAKIYSHDYANDLAISPQVATEYMLSAMEYGGSC